MPGAAGRGRWKIGWPGTGRPGAGRAVADPCAVALGGGALYTGRGPVCGMMTRGFASSVGFGGGGATGCFTSTAGGAAATGGGGSATGPFATGGGVVGAGGATGVAAGTVNTGRGVAGGGTIRRGFGVSTGAGAGGAGFASTTGGFAATGGLGAGGAGGGACTGPAFLLMIAFSTSPGLEMCDRSILVLIASGSVREEADFAVEASAWPRKWRRTRSASSNSSELEWVFFSVTPTSARTSRIDLLLTSSSLARSLIRILLIRPQFPPLSR